jgi:DNA-directed RNA polymerase delta subunit
MTSQDYKMTRQKQKHLDWAEIIKKVQEKLLEYEKRKIKPTLTAMFYRLYSKGLIRNTRKSINGN